MNKRACSCPLDVVYVVCCSVTDITNHQEVLPSLCIYSIMLCQNCSVFCHPLLYLQMRVYVCCMFAAVFHPVQCDGCHRESFTGFRYRCQRCHNYQLCQDCFWRGRTSAHHSPDHQMKEYLSYVSNHKLLHHYN